MMNAPLRILSGFAGLLSVFLPIGCQPKPAVPNAVPPAPLGSQFQQGDSGTFRGRVHWPGSTPVVEPIKLPFHRTGLEREYANPNAPRIDPKSGGVEGVLVYLRGIDLARSRPWSHHSVQVAFRDGSLKIMQGDRPVRIGLVRRGEAIACSSSEAKSHTLEARGKIAFSLPLLNVDKITKRVLDHLGMLELSSGSAYFWLRGHLWIGEHPYAAVTAADGSFELSQVPAGKYELVCWSPNWNIVRRERHPDFGEIERLIFAPGMERSVPIEIAAGATTSLDIALTIKDFALSE